MVTEHLKNFIYDGFGRLKEEQYAILDISELNIPELDSVNAKIEHFYYKNHNLLKQSIYRYMSPDQRYLNYGYSVVNKYSVFGQLLGQDDPVNQSNPHLVKNLLFDVRGQRIQQNFVMDNQNNHIINIIERYPSTGQVKAIHNPSISGNAQRLYYQYDAWGNLINQQQSGTSSVSESFKYDKLQRLDEATVGVDVVDYDYDALGNLVKKSDYADTQVYGGSAGPNAITESVLLNNLGSIDYHYDNNGNLTHTTGAQNRQYRYDAHNQLLKATEGFKVTEFRYDANNSRYFKHDNIENEYTLYLGDRFELILKGTEKSSKFRLTDNIMITRDTNNVVKRNYLQKDRLGSVSKILDENGLPLHIKSYDAFGKPRNGTDWQPEPQLDFTEVGSTIDITKRGFTEHEHLDNFELIHMNGRMYDFNNGRFLSVDPFIQGTDSQAINPYSYIQNNPLSGVDPTGYYIIPDNCNPADMNCSKANYTIKQMQDDLSGQTDNGHDNRFQLQNAGANKIGNSLTLADLKSQVGTVNLLPLDLEPTREKILDGDFVVGEKFNFPWSEYDEQHIRAELYQEYRSQMSDDEYKKTIGSAIDALSVSIKLAEFHNSASQNNIHGLGLFYIDGEFQVSDASHVTYNNRTIQNTPGKLQFFLEHQISIYNGKENDMVGLFYMRGRVNQIMGRYSKEFQGIADDTGVPVIFTDNNPAPYRDGLTPPADRVGSTYLWLPNYKIQFKDNK